MRLARGKSVAEALRAENNMAGQLREVVAKHPELTAAKKLAGLQTAAGRNTAVVEIPRDLDDQVKQMARNYLTEAATALNGAP